jgi:hypothetical protein
MFGHCRFFRMSEADMPYASRKTPKPKYQYSPYGESLKSRMMEDVCVVMSYIEINK